MAALLFAFTRPDSIFIERSIIISMPPAIPFGIVEDLRNWPGWSADEIAAISRSYGPASRGVGAVCDWSGTANAGRMTVLGATADSEIVIAVRFERPFRAHNINTFRFEAEGSNATRVTWTMRGTNVLLLKLMSVLRGPDRILGSHLERGLARLKARAESAAVGKIGPSVAGS